MTNKSIFITLFFNCPFNIFYSKPALISRFMHEIFYLLNKQRATNYVSHDTLISFCSQALKLKTHIFNGLINVIRVVWSSQFIQTTGWRWTHKRFRFLSKLFCWKWVFISNIGWTAICHNWGKKFLMQKSFNILTLRDIHCYFYIVLSLH